MERDAEAGDVSLLFGRTGEWFVAGREEGVQMARVGVVAERAVDLMHSLSDQLDPVVDVVIESFRDGVRWSGSLLPLADVRDALGRLRLLLAAYGGVEVSVVTADDQITLTPELELVIYSRTDRWLFLLEGLGLQETEKAPRPTWMPDRGALPRMAPLTDGLIGAATRLGLVESQLPPVRSR